MYPGGCGGNHILNLISTIDTVEPIFSNYNQDYITALRNRYMWFAKGPNMFKVHVTGKNHLHELQNNSDPEHYKVKLNENNKTNAFYGHWASFEQTLHKGNFVNLNDSVWIIVTWPSPNSLPMQRIDKHNFYPQQPDKYTLPLEITLPNAIAEKIVGQDKVREIILASDYEEGELESTDVFPKITLADENNGLLIEVEKYFTIDGWDYLNSKLNEYLGLELPSKSKEIHDIWISAITEELR
jgi:hypothetical protein